MEAEGRIRKWSLEQLLPLAQPGMFSLSSKRKTNLVKLTFTRPEFLRTKRKTGQPPVLALVATPCFWPFRLPGNSHLHGGGKMLLCVGSSKMCAAPQRMSCLTTACP